MMKIDKIQDGQNKPESQRVRSVMFDQHDGTISTVTVYPDESARMLMVKNGFVEAGQRFVAGIAPAWAKVAQENQVCNEFEIRDNSLVQRVTPQSKDGYPIVAGPFLGKHLFKDFWQGEWNGDAV
ncbi:hypothetical protein [Corynebacterium epidermidicanis]|uniref:hypothetical protein n=1 Tax=Corynebacterium epidermidicanis TaxID=1050174 RepID=UPI00118742F9|nr:hypothetical protein [Corynebacterium epidermidicanis]